MGAGELVIRYFLVILLALFLQSCATVVDESKDEGLKDNYIRYIPKGDLGGVQCLQQTFVHPETGKTVELLGMIHIADGAFYKKVQERLDAADVVLMEGVSGSTSLSLFDLHLRYTMSFMKRSASMLNLSEQHASLKDNGNWRNADWTLEQFKKESGFGQTLIQAITLPITVVVGEPSMFLTRLSVGFGQNASWPWADSLQSHYRHELFQNVGKQAKDSQIQNAIYKGIIEGRNQEVLKHMDEALLEDDTKHVLIPWGAAHLPSLEKSLLERGFKKKEGKWLRAICAKDISEHGGRDEFVIPYVFRRTSYMCDQEELAFLLDLFYFYRSDKYNSNEFLWSLGGAYHSSGENVSFHLLPRLFGKPIFFSFAENEERKRWRFLYFFKIDSEKE